MEHHHHQADTIKAPWTNWLPLIVVLGYIAGLTAIFAVITEITVFNVFTYSMGFFFIVFSLFKMINLSGFAMGYHEYDLISKRWYGWGYAYPFVELALGIMYLLRIDAIALHLVTIILSAIVCIGVGIKLAKREKFFCACLGTVLKVPLTKVSLIEYAVMGSMAIAMIFWV